MGKISTLIRSENLKIQLSLSSQNWVYVKWKVLIRSQVESFNKKSLRYVVGDLIWILSVDLHVHKKILNVVWFLFLLPKGLVTLNKKRKRRSICKVRRLRSLYNQVWLSSVIMKSVRVSIAWSILIIFIGLIWIVNLYIFIEIILI